MPLKKIHLSPARIYFKKNKKKLTFKHESAKRIGTMAGFNGR
jgi:hypothetical protein